MAANYNCLLFDLDGTLMDFSAAEREAIAGTLREFSLPDTQEAITSFSSINNALWADLEKGEIKKDKLVVKRFQDLLQALGAKGDPVRMNNEYMTRLSASASIYPGADELLAELAEFATLAVVSNGIYKVQKKRLEKSGLMCYFDDVFVSEKLGVNKPAARFFELALKKLGLRNRDRVLVVGDSLTADIKGGMSAGLDTCWVNHGGIENHTNIKPTYTVTSFAELKLVAIGEEELRLAESREKRHLV